MSNSFSAIDKRVLSGYFSQLRDLLEPPWLHERISDMADKMLEVKGRDGKLLLAGNGASASIASHFALDFSKQASVRSMAFNDAALLTAFGNDYGYEHWVARAIENYARPGDAVVLISSSGRSANVVNGADAARAAGLDVITFTGFAGDNPLKARGGLNFWLGSELYNVIESVHATWLGAVCDVVTARVAESSS